MVSSSFWKKVEHTANAVVFTDFSDVNLRKMNAPNIKRGQIYSASQNPPFIPMMKEDPQKLMLQ